MSHPAITDKAAKFFYDHAGYSHPADASEESADQYRIAQAYELSLAELAYGHDEDLHFEWEVDSETAASHFGYEPMEDEEDYDLWICMLINDAAHPEDNNVLASLGAIDLGPHGDPYGDPLSADSVPDIRVIEARLAQEGMQG